jgi:guanosine-3',5'-bis(diphosphate) 3'-pyrophosphohydrolase
MEHTASRAPFCQQTWKRALAIAARAHGNQKTPHGYPYVLHLTSVAMEVMAAIVPDGMGEDEANLALQCALLHDVLEDTPWSTADLKREGLAEPVIAGVRALTKDSALPKSEQMADSLRRLCEQPAAVQRVKLADRITNLDPPPGHWTAEKIRAYADEAALILQTLQSASPSLARRLEARLADYRAAYPGR